MAYHEAAKPTPSRPSRRAAGTAAGQSLYRGRGNPTIRDAIPLWRLHPTIDALSHYPVFQVPIPSTLNSSLLALLAGCNERQTGYQHPEEPRASLEVVCFLFGRWVASQQADNLKLERAWKDTRKALKKNKHYWILLEAEVDAKMREEEEVVGS
ncbi:uncharacterized protein LAESUDRAFT_810758 [Laetiporus sulphureus 93-53]|uniref:Uncharacterized protein n=1 Tax=Laetiporus sulphureus 93-53 TaxID=1314785 RepID=A0A165FKC6_9APHY|nr:uncharacterized protein LAESUDRAFT_810758 [Laetiporus sulphureus 93-53]KZT09104.1 hypothetical protein LAESUDRAFT_810758 [Laetiporus sulphureus 93-53]